MRGVGYELLEDGDVFQQYKKSEAALWPLDLMLVRENTFDGLLAAAAPASVQGARVLVVSLDHLIALKLHALKQARLHRFLKDYQDVVELVRINNLDLRSDQMSDLFLRYGTPDLYEKIQRALQQ